MKNLKTILCVLSLVPFTLISQEVEEIIVTANKKAETVQEIPMNISVITESAIEERGITNPEDYLRSIAGVSTPGGSNYYTFRGLNTSTSQRSSGTTSTYIDEVSGMLMGLFDVERIEVLRGPQGTLYGRNSIGGVINYVTKKPNSDEHEAAVRGSNHRKVFRRTVSHRHIGSLCCRRGGHFSALLRGRPEEEDGGAEGGVRSGVLALCQCFG